MKICHVCNEHSVDDARVFHRQCQGLAKAGHEVHLFAVADKTAMYVQGDVTIHPMPRSASRIERFRRSRQIAQRAAELQPDIFHVHEPDLLGPILTRSATRPVIYDVHESYVDVLMDRDWIPKWGKGLFRFLWDHYERRLVPKCAAVVVVTAEIARRYRKMHPHVRVVHNYPELPNVVSIRPPADAEPACVYAGALMPGRGLPETLEALATLRERGLSVKLWLAGLPSSEEYISFLYKEAQKLCIQDLVEYKGVLSREETLGLQCQAAVGLAVYSPLPNNVAGMPNKLAEYMLLGTPSVFSNFPAYRQVAGTSGAGIAVDPTNPREIADAIQVLIENPDLARAMGAAGQRAARERFNWQKEQHQLLDLYAMLANNRNELPSRTITA